VSTCLDYFDYSSLRELSHPDFIFKVGTIVDLGLAHPGLQDVPEDAGGPAVIDVLNQSLSVSVHAAANKDQYYVAQSNAIRQDVQEHVEMWGQFIVMRSKRRKDPSLLLNAGLDPKKKAGKTASANKGVTPVTQDVKVSHGPVSQTLLVTCKSMGRRGAYEIRYSTDPGNELGWIDGDHHTTCRNMPISGVVPGTKYYICVRFHGANGTGPWSEPVCIIAL
jgi:hypothetical protein